MSIKTLIFPITTPSSQEFLKNSIDSGLDVVCGSNDLRDPTGGAAPWFHLPIIHDEKFVEAFVQLVSSQQIGRVFIGAHMVHAALREIVSQHHDLRHLKIINRSQFQEELDRWDNIFVRAEKWREISLNLFPSAEPPPITLVAGTIKVAFHVFGESYDDKLAALLACLGQSPHGDIVEIGSLFGRSACVLLAGREFQGFDRKLVTTQVGSLIRLGS